MNKIVILVLIFILGFFVFKIIDKEKINNDMEKVGQLDFSLPRNDQNITTESGDLILLFIMTLIIGVLLNWVK